MTTRYLSWDVGIANLAYCLIERQGEVSSGTFQIIKWGIINLRDPPPICHAHTKGLRCERVAVSYAGDAHFCKRHSKEYVPVPVERTPCDDGDRCRHSLGGTGNPCGKKANAKVEGIAYCRTHTDAHVRLLTKERSLQKVTRINANKIPLQTLAVKLFGLLDQIPEFLTVAEVLIENQPTLKNPTMKTIASLLFSYFILRGVIDRGLPAPDPALSVRFICPANKLKVGGDVKVTGTDERKVYVLTKKLGVKFCKELIKHDETQVQFLASQKKQDDLCDAFLQGYYYIFCRVGVPAPLGEILSRFVEEAGERISPGEGVGPGQGSGQGPVPGIDLSDLAI